MGNSTNSFNQNFLNDWMQIDRIRSFQNDKIIWAKKNNKSLQMEEYNLNVSSKEQLEEEQKIHAMRQNHPQLVSSLHFQDETEEQFCSSNYKGKIYIERIPLSLQSITDIPFPDALHIYSQSLQGFHSLTNQVESGCFPVSEQLIGINCESVCKVWLNNKFNRNYPSRNQRITEERMVKNILDTIQENADLGSLQGKPSPVQYIYSRARTPSQVKFGEAINLLRDYANQFFGGLIPSKVSCVQKVGGAFLLSRNWEGQKAQITQQIPQQIQQRNINLEAQRTNIYPQGFTNLIPQQNQGQNYTAFRREEPIQKPVIIGQTPVFAQGSVQRKNQQMQPNVINTSNIQPNLMQSSQVKQNIIEQPQASPNIVPQPIVPQRVQAPPLAQQIIYRNQIPNINPQINEVRRSQFVIQLQQQQIPQSFTQTVSQPVTQPVPQTVIQTQSIPQTQNNNGASLLLFNSPRRELRQNLIENRVQQVTSQKGIILQPLSYGQPQPVIGQYPMNIQQQPVQQVLKSSQVPIVQQQQNVTNVRKSTIIFNNSGQRYETQTVVKSSQVVTKVEKQVKIQGRQMINNSELQKVNSKLVFIDKNSPTRYSQKQDIKKKEVSPSLNDYSSSYYAFTNKLYDREESSPKETGFKFQTKEKYQPKDTEFKYSPKETEFKSLKLRTQDFSSVNYDLKESKEQNKGKFSVSLDDGMSSPDFLNQLKNMNIGSTYKPTDNKFDLGSSYSSYLKKDYSNPIDYSTSSPVNYSTSRLYENKETGVLNKETGVLNNQRGVLNNQRGVLNKQVSRDELGLYKMDYKDYTTTLSDGLNHENDLVVIGSKIDITPLETNQASGRQDYRMSYQYQEGQTPSGNLHYEEEILYIHNPNQTLQQTNFNSNYHDNNYQQQIQSNYYKETTYQEIGRQNNNNEQQQQLKRQNNNEQFEGQRQNKYQSIFDKYASLAKQQTSAEKSFNNTQQYPIHNQNLGDNIQTFNSINNPDQPQYQQSNQHSQEYPQQYKVQFDPQILADLQKLKGVN